MRIIDAVELKATSRIAGISRGNSLMRKEQLAFDLRHPWEDVKANSEIRRRDSLKKEWWGRRSSNPQPPA